VPLVSRRFAFVVASVALVGACQPSSAPAPALAQSRHDEVTAPPVAVPPPARDASAAPPANPRATAAIARVPAIAEAVARIRHLSLKHPVEAAVQGHDDFRRYLEAEVAKELPPDKAAQSTRALVRLGFLKGSVDLGRTIEDAMLSQAGAYYDPDTRKFYVVLVPEDAAMLDVMSAHELTHALDDQYFDLGAYTRDPNHELTNDEQQARRMVGEGDATLVMLGYQARTAAHQDIFDPKNRAVSEAILDAFTALDPETLAHSSMQAGPEVQASIDAMASIPPFILEPLFGAYTRGAAAVEAVREAGGWDAVSALYVHPPESTEQLLHPAQKLIGKRELPVDIAFAPAPRLFDGLAPLDTDVLGELTMAVYFKLWGDRVPADEVVGWGGDRYAAFEVGGQVVGVWMTTWDTGSDASRFARAYAASLGRRFPGEAKAAVAGAAGVRHADATVTVAARAGKDVAIVDGAPDGEARALLDWLSRSNKRAGRVITHEEKEPRRAAVL
jgi:hypothetical protein